MVASEVLANPLTGRPPVRYEPYTIAIVVDPDFGEKLRELAGRMPVWIASTPENRRVAERVWTERPYKNQEGVTTFVVDLAATPEEWCADVLGSVDLHHGQYSHDPPYSAVEVFGVQLSDVLADAFRDYDFTMFSTRLDGFRAERPMSANQA